MDDTRFIGATFPQQNDPTLPSAGYCPPSNNTRILKNATHTFPRHCKAELASHNA